MTACCQWLHQCRHFCSSGNWVECTSSRWGRLRDQAEELPVVGGGGRNSVPTATAEDEHPPGIFSPFWFVWIILTVSLYSFRTSYPECVHTLPAVAVIVTVTRTMEIMVLEPEGFGARRGKLVKTMKSATPGNICTAGPRTFRAPLSLMEPPITPFTGLCLHPTLLWHLSSMSLPRSNFLVSM